MKKIILFSVFAVVCLTMASCTEDGMSPSNGLDTKADGPVIGPIIVPPIKPPPVTGP